ncbi:MAG: hypothetical protein A3A73_04575 [Omnitrophica bacterium RIFCSPLOWO2_01_FULL_50_24]|nr:MAG: hypothetical protein A3A73_04575 [Omnitrophica bacterium RIFCSPLOWO2_01_FULL_50_24]
MTHIIPAVSQFMLLVVLLALSAFFSGSETALFSLSKIEKRRLMNHHPFAWKTISSLLERPRRTLVTILIGNMIVNTMATAVVTIAAIEWFGPEGVGWTIAVFTFVLLMTGELTPKVFAVRNNELVAFFSAIPLDLFARLLYPIRWVVRRVADRVLSFLIHEEQTEADLVSETELKTLARIGEEEGALRSEEREMIQKLIGLGDRMVREIMVPRPDIIAFDLAESPDRLIALIQRYHFSYVPVYQGSVDNLLGVISTQRFMLAERGQLRELIEPVRYTPETNHIDELLQSFHGLKHQVAICVDEHGDTAGLVTMEDVLEEIFGEFYDEYSRDESAVKALGGSHFLVQGKIGLHDLKESLGIDLESSASETLSGWLMERFGKIPKVNETYRWKGIEFHIREVFRQRILKVEIRKK